MQRRLTSFASQRHVVCSWHAALHTFAAWPLGLPRGLREAAHACALLRAQHCPPGRFALVATVGLTLYLTGLAPLRRLLRRLASLVPALHMPLQPGPPGAGDPPVARPPNAPPGPPRNAGAGGAAEAPAPDVFGVGPGGGPGGAPGAEDRAGAHGPAPLQALAQRGLVHELQALLIGFFTSLLPGAPLRTGTCVCMGVLAWQHSNRCSRECRVTLYKPMPRGARSLCSARPEVRC